MDKETRNKIRNTVLEIRRILEADISDQLEGIYGIARSGKAQPIEGMTTLQENPVLRYQRQQIDAALGHERDAGLNAKQAIEQFIHETAYTALNRLVAVKMLEARALLTRTAVGEGRNSAGFKDFQMVAPQVCQSQADGGYQSFLELLFDELAASIRPLFDRRGAHSIIFPRWTALGQVIKLLNAGELAGIWQEDETIGWVYQYFNTPDREKVRKGGRPTRPQDVAVINQFYTPRYVVEFLVDNTLGRLWYEMRQGETQLVEKCRYLVRRKHPIFLREGEQAPEPFEPRKARLGDPDLPGEMWMRPNPHLREISDIFQYALTVGGYDYSREHLGVECSDLANDRLHRYHASGEWQGSFDELRCCLFFEQRRYHHFGQGPEGEAAKAIQALHQAICERWDLETEVIPYRPPKDPRHLKILDPAVGSGHFLHYAFDLLAIMYQEAGYPADDIPTLILQNNLHGIDIDPRAAQLAAFTLYLRARAYEIAQGAPAQARLPTANIVVAEPMPGDKRLFEEFLSEQPEVIRNICRKVWDMLELAAEVGSLLKVEVALDEAIAAERARLKKEPLFDVEKLADNNLFWEELKNRIVGLFHEYYRHALGQADLSRILFAAEGEQGFRFLDLLRQDYDVVLMNPPYGDTTDTAKEYLEAYYPDTKNDLYAAFIERALAFLRATGGYVGAITSRTFMFLSSFQKLRENVIFPQARISPVADLGFGVLDTAMVETVAFVLEKGDGVESTFFRLLLKEDKETTLFNCITNLAVGQANDLTYIAHQETFSLIPGSTMPYWVSDNIRQIFFNRDKLKEQGVSVQQGASTKYDFRFLRVWWEVAPENIMIDKEEVFKKSWALFAKGGEHLAYYMDVHLLVNWGDNASEIKQYLIQRYPYLQGNTDWVIHPQNDYFRQGLVYTLSTVLTFTCRILPLGCVFGHVGPAIFPSKNRDIGYWLGILNSRCVQFLLRLICIRNYEIGYVQQLPVPVFNKKAAIEISEKALYCYHLLRDLDRSNENSHAFTHSVLFGFQITDIIEYKNHKPSTSILVETLLSWLAVHENAEVQVNGSSYQIDQKVLELYGITERDQRTIDRELRPHPGSYPHKDEWRQDEDEKLRLLYLTKEVLPEESNEEDIQDDDDYADHNQRRSRRATYRTLEEIAHELKIHPASIAARRQALGLYRPEEFREAVADLISYCVGCLFQRWDIRIGAGELEPPPLPDPEEGLPLYPPGALRPDSPPMEAKGALAKVIEHSAGRGILVDDPGHQHDLVAGVEACLSYLFGEEKLPAIRGEIKEALGRDLRSWLARSFFPFHIKRYSKSRRKAPIYWQLSTPSKGYSLWLYYHAIGADTLYTAVREYVSPKIQFEEQRLAELKRTFERLKTSGPAREARGAEKAVEDQESFLQELYAFRSELQRLADWGYNPDLNDGVILNIAPLHRLVPWHEAEKYWEQLVQGEYDWSSMSKNLYRK